MTGISESEDRLGPLMDEFLERKRKGEFPALTEFVQRHPDLEEEIRDLFPAVAMLEQAESGAVPRTEVTRDGAELRSLGEYRIIREIGRGGMGVVYEAIQESLGRHVAIKVLPWQCVSDERQVKRFRREARISASLHHTNIVPVFAVGESDGVHFLAMQYIRGQSLDSVLTELRRLRLLNERTATRRGTRESHAEPVVPDSNPASSRVSRRIAASLVLKDWRKSTPSENSRVAQPASLTATPLPGSGTESELATSSSFLSAASEISSGTRLIRKAAELIASVADALDYAHSQGVIHRDVKPANLMIDVEGGIWVTDFGLARADDSITASLGDDSRPYEDLTGTGDLIGTIRYLSPERFQGVNDARSDIYSLGLTLYEFLTQRPAFSAVDRLSLIRMITSGPPPPVRKLAPDVPRDLETIIVKATKMDPDLRYQSAADMAADLRCFLSARPIVARRTTVVERLLMWCRRHPAIAALSSLVMTLLTVLAVGASITAVRLDASLIRAQAAEQAERSARAAATRNLFEAYTARAGAELGGVRPGRRVNSLAVVREATALQKDVKITPAESLQLRNLAIRAMALDDLSADCRREMSEQGAANDKFGFDSDIAHIARVTTDGKVVLCSVASTEVLEELEGVWKMGGEAPYTRISPGNRFIAIHGAMSDRATAVSLWDREKCEFLLEQVPTGANDYSRNIAFSSDGKRFGYIEHSQLVTLDLATGKQASRRKLTQHSDCFCFCPHGDHVVVCQGNNAAILAIEEDDRITILRHDSGIIDAEWSPDGRFIATSSYDENVYVWDVQNPEKPVSTCRGHTAAAVSVKFSPDGKRLVSNGWDATSRVWQPLLGMELMRMTERAAGFSSDGKYLGFEDSARVYGRWAVSSDEFCASLAGMNRALQVEDLTIHPDGSLLAFIDDLGLYLYSWPERRLLRQLRPFAKYMSCEFSPDGESLIIGGAGRVIRFRTSDLLSRHANPEAELLLSSENTQWPVDFALDPVANRLLCSPGTGEYRYLALATESPTDTFAFPRNDAEHWFVSISPNGRFAGLSGKRSTVAAVMDTQTGLEAFHRDLRDDGSLIIFAPDDQRVAISSLGSVEFVSTDTWQTRFTFRWPEAFLGAVAFSPDKQFVAIQTLSKIHLLDFATFGHVAEFVPPYGESLCAGAAEMASAMRFSPDSAWLICGTRDNTIHGWDLRAIQTELKTMDLGWDENLTVTQRRLDRNHSETTELSDICPFTFTLSAEDQRAQKLAELNAACDANPEDVAALRARAEFHSAQQNHAEAIYDWTNLIALTPQDVSARLSRAAELTDVGRNREAIMDYETLLPIDDLDTQDRLTVSNNLAWLLCIGPVDLRDPPRALKLSRQAVEDSPGTHYTINTLAWSLYRNGEYEEAYDLLTVNIKDESNSTKGYDWLCLAMCSHQLGLTGEVDHAWEESLRCIPATTDSELSELHVLCREVAATIGPR